MNQNLFQRFLTSKVFPYVAGGLILLLIVLTFVSYRSKNQSISNGQNSGLSGLFKLSDLFGSQNRQVADVQQTIKDQLIVNQELANWEKKVAGRYPWRKKLPLTSDKYFIYFDLTKKSFIGRLYPDNDDLIEQIKADAIRILKKEKGIPLETFTVDWDVYPKSNL
ncbi:hypothetical protein A3A74_01970 [Candidatus Roizmanbacteria bacterium RIFCSPLOWO2_01_FULL_35_13]|uniref:Uncharacterized protein n=1 Tax=Candidatus Roizmanbacteria bacterium RIFCSPLOWO2_01_FULL_35_13 TaxID=1802055 RepID=A0A1F7I9J9_9BACT|nr:MAG: hypothetical protein A3A74_01970 [Candidatus Roizmanbacteria bacterium RIFCSPLOWO2_01_FULL_35_13]